MQCRSHFRFYRSVKAGCCRRFCNDNYPDRGARRLCRKPVVNLGCGMRVLHFRGNVFMFSDRHYNRSVILLCVRWYLAYNLSLRDLEEMMAERGIHVDHSTIHRWVVRFSPLLLERFNHRKRSVTRKWHVDETYVMVRGRWMYLYRAIEPGRYSRVFLQRTSRSIGCQTLHSQSVEPSWPTRSHRHRRQQTNREAIIACDGESRLRNRSRRSLKPIRIRQVNI